jgi:transcriptional regulator of arginine metabolism
MSSKNVSDTAERLSSLRKLLSAGLISTQEELVEELGRQKFRVTQSTISRDLRKIGAIKGQDATGRTVYRLPDESSMPAIMPGNSFGGLLVNIQHNGSLIVINTTPGSASLVARQLDQTKPEGILGTIAGDDTIFVAPVSPRKIEQTIAAITALFA